MKQWWAVVVVASLASGCVSQAHSINYGDGASEPECDDGDDSVVADRVAGAAAADVAHHVARHSHSGKTAAAAGLLGLFALVAGEVAASEDEKAVEHCRDAKDDWYAAQRAAARAHPRNDHVRHQTARGFYCARSASRDDVSLCTRDQAACDEDSDEIRVGMPDVGSCVKADAAWCLVGHCYANLASCERRLVPGTVGTCEELP